MALNDLILNGVISMENMLVKNTFTWKGETFSCIANTVNDAEKSSDAGFSENADFRMTVRLNQFTPNIYPALNDYIYFQGYKLLIKTIKKPAHNVYWVYVCELPSVTN